MVDEGIVLAALIWLSAVINIATFLVLVRGDRQRSR